MYSFYKIKLKIDEPCSENWAKMTDAEKGKFCSLCQKEVVDFTGYTDGELLNYFSNSGKNQCGKLAPYQLDRTISNLPPRERTVFPKLIFSSLVALFSTKVSFAQKVAEPTVQEVPTKMPVIMINEIPIEHQEDCNQDAEDVRRDHGSIGRVGGIRVEIVELDKEFEKQKGLLFLRSLSPW